MALQKPVAGAAVSQGFGPSALGVEPSMYTDGPRAWWNPFAGARFVQDFHAAIDYAAPGGTPIVASEAGTVIESYFDRDFGGGHKVRIQIRPGVSYCSNHMSRRSVSVGQHVRRGQKIGEVGTTGASTGNHDHFWVGIDDEVGSQAWPTLYNPRLFLSGGSLADDPRIRPLDTTPYVVLNGPGINIRGTADLDSGSANIYATSRADGIYRSGKRIAGLGKRFEFLRNVTTDDGEFAKVLGFGRTLFIYRTLVHRV